MECQDARESSSERLHLAEPSQGHRAALGCAADRKEGEAARAHVLEESAEPTRVRELDFVAACLGSPCLGVN